MQAHDIALVLAAACALATLGAHEIELTPGPEGIATAVQTALVPPSHR